MNVKRKQFQSNDKQNVSYTSNLSIPIKNKKSTGEEIRSRLRTKPTSIEFQSILMPKNQNFKIQPPRRTSRLLSTYNNFKNDRNNYMQKSVQISKDTSKSVKSVRFDESCDEAKLNRKHSTTSILKKNHKVVKKVGVSDKVSMNNSICSNIHKDDQSTENLPFNKINKEKYDKLSESLKKSGKKYNDELFPHIWSSICRAPDQIYKQIKWVRLSELFCDKVITVWNCQQNIKILPGDFSASYIQSTCFNSIKNNNLLLQKLFESQKFSPNGIYYVKIFQNNCWKYILVDDYVPVCQSEGKTVPAFLNVQSSNDDSIQIWPYLLQKAYAKYYSNYECLELGNQIQFLQQLTGCYPQQLDSATQYDKVVSQSSSYDTILIGKGHNNMYYPFLPRQQSLTCQNPEKQYTSLILSQSVFQSSFPKFYIVQLHKYFYSGFCTIKYNTKLQSQTQPQISVRSVKIQEGTQCVFGLAQKDGKHYYLGDYRYVWVRVIVVMKESQRNYRWVNGVYGCSKYVQMGMWLEPGEYFILVIPEWKGKGYDLSLNFQGNTKVNIDRKPYIGNQNILIEAAMDLAQIKGKMKQLNQNICTYTHIDYSLGFIIQNINNQRPNGHVRILRSIEGLQNNQNEIKAFNLQFKNKPTVQVRIQSLQHFTVVLGVGGGVNMQFLKQFDFGS